MKFVYGAKCIGKSHEASGKVCQDSFCHVLTEVAMIAAVADGVGSEMHSDMASECASKVAVSYCAENISKGMENDDVLGVIYKSFNIAWRSVEEKANKLKYDVQQCNTTLSLAVLIEGNLYFGHAGDSGIFAFLDNGKICPITVPQNDSLDLVYPLAAGSKKWEFGKVPQIVVSVLLCTDGLWGMFFPERLDNCDEKHSVPLLAWYIDPLAIKTHCGIDSSFLLSAASNPKYNDILTNWLEEDLREINEKEPRQVRHDDMAMVILYDAQVGYKRQCDGYYEMPINNSKGKSLVNTSEIKNCEEFVAINHSQPFEEEVHSPNNTTGINANENIEVLEDKDSMVENETGLIDETQDNDDLTLNEKQVACKTETDTIVDNVTIDINKSGVTINESQSLGKTI